MSSLHQIRLLSYSVIIIVLILLPSKKSRDHDHYERNDGESFLLANAATIDDDDVPKQFRRIFVQDIKKLLTHNQVFYNTYWPKDDEVDLAFDEARIAADIIFLYPEIFHLKVKNINYQISEARNKKTEPEVSMTADGVPVYFIDNHLILLGTIGGVLRFPDLF